MVAVDAADLPNCAAAARARFTDTKSGYLTLSCQNSPVNRRLARQTALHHPSSRERMREGHLTMRRRRAAVSVAADDRCESVVHRRMPADA